MTASEFKTVERLSAAVDDYERRLQETLAGRRPLSPENARKCFYALEDFCDLNAGHLNDLDGCGSEYWMAVAELQERLAEVRDEVRRFI